MALTEMGTRPLPKRPARVPSAPARKDVQISSLAIPLLGAPLFRAPLLRAQVLRAPLVRAQVLRAQSARIDGVSGVTCTSDGYVTLRQSALDPAGFPS